MGSEMCIRDSQEADSSEGEKVVVANDKEDDSTDGKKAESEIKPEK